MASKKIVFVSYSSDRAEHIQNINTLFSQDYELCYDMKDKDHKSGSFWRPELIKDMDRCDAAIILCSDTYVKSPECVLEFGYLRGSKKKLIPILLEKMDSNLTTLFNETYMLNGGNPLESHDSNWLEALKTISADIESAISSRKSTVNKEIEFNKVLRLNVKELQPMDQLSRDDKKKIAEGYLTPFIGPLCHTVSQGNKKTENKFWQKINLLIQHLDEDAELNYLKELIIPRLHTSVHQEVFSKPKKTRSSASPMITFQIILTKIGVLLQKIVGQSMAQQLIRTIDLNHYEIVISSDEEASDIGLYKNIDALFILLKTSCEKSLKFSRDMNCNISHCRSKQTYCFPSNRIAEKLVKFSVQILNTKIFKGNDKIKKWLEAKGESPLFTKAFSIRFDQLEWLAGLLWYTLRFDMPIYPDYHDLGFYLSLCEETTPAIRIRTGQAASAYSSFDYDCIYRTYATVSQNNKLVYNKFYKVIAKSFSAKLLQKVDKTITSLAPENLPIAISSNFDLELESVIHEMKLPCYVVIPVLLGSIESSDNEYQLRWALIEKKNGNNLVSNANFYLLNDDLEYGTIRHILDIQGPIIVKMNGSPLDRLEHLKGTGIKLITNADGVLIRDNCIIKHWIVASDFELFKSVFYYHRLPSWIKRLLGDPKRILAFLGYYLDDTHGLVGLHIDSELSSNERRNTVQWIVEKPTEKLSHADLKYLGVTRLNKSINDFINEIDSIVNCKVRRI